MNFNDLLANNTYKLIISIFIIGIIYFIRTLVNKYINSHIQGIKPRYISRQKSNYTAIGIVLLILILLWLEWFQSILTVLSISVAAFIIISKEFIINFTANGVIITRGLFEAGDRIQIGEHSGDVIEKGPLFFSLAEIGKWAGGDEATGRIIKIPNSLVLVQPLANYSRGLSLIWDEISLDLTLDSDWREAKRIALETAFDFSHQITSRELKELKDNSEEVMFVQTEPSVLLNVKDSKFILTIRFICKFHKRRFTQQQILESLLNKFEKEEKIFLSGQTKSA